MTARRAGAAPEAIPGARVVVDVRPLQERERTPITAAYLERLLAAYAAEPLADESFMVVLRAMREDPTIAFEDAGLPVVGRRTLPPTSRFFRNAGLTLDSFLLRGAEVRSAAGARESGAAGAVYHTAGGAVPLASGLPVVATLLDLAPWELPERYAASPAARFGQRLRVRTLHDAARVIVTSRADADAARRLLHLPEERVAVVPLAADAEFQPASGDDDAGRLAALRARFDLPERYLVFAGRYDARQDFATLFGALVGLREEGSAGGARGRGTRRSTPRSGTDGDGEMPWPPIVVLAGAAGDQHADSPVVARSAERAGAAELVRLTPRLEASERATLMRGATALVMPALSDGTGLSAIEALAVGIPVVCTRVGGLAEVVGPAGIIVEPGDGARLATALRAVWDGGAVARQVTRRARERAARPRRTWSEVAAETRRVYAQALGVDGE